MLLNLHVKNLALIEEAEVDFSHGLNILSGETGAGKSIVIGSIGLALGEKLSKEMLRNPEEDAFVELIFVEENKNVLNKLSEMGIDAEDGQLILTRKITKGRSICRINSEAVSAALMKKAALLLIDIHGQHETHFLLAAKNHLKFVDDYAGDKILEKKGTVAQLYRQYIEKTEELKKFSMDIRDQERELSLLEYEVKEIQEANLVIGEDEQLESEYKRLFNGKKIMEAVGSAHDCISGGGDNASDQISRALRELLYVSDYDQELNNLAEQMQEIDNLISDLSRELSGYLDDNEFSDEQFREVDSRLNTINHLKDKYGNTIEDILQVMADKEEQIDQIRHFDAYREKIKKELKGLTIKLQNESDQLSELRKAAEKEMSGLISEALKDLNFADVRFQMEFKRLEHFTGNGLDEGRFMISTNPGEPMKYLDKVASGGELSRIMLALKTVLADKDETGALIFDEIDSGISGRTAQKVAEKMKVIGKSHQIICITHLPQIAAMADSHYLIEKISEDDETQTHIRPLKGEEEIAELARMLGGVKITDAVIENAREMKALAKNI